MLCRMLAAVEMKISVGHAWLAAVETKIAVGHVCLAEAEMKIPLAGSRAQTGGKC